MPNEKFTRKSYIKFSITISDDGGWSPPNMMYSGHVLRHSITLYGPAYGEGRGIKETRHALERLLCPAFMDEASTQAVFMDFIEAVIKNGACGNCLEKVPEPKSFCPWCGAKFLPPDPE